MKKLFLLAIIFCLGSQSCDRLGIGKKIMNSESGLDSALEAARKNIDTENYKPVRLTIMEADKLSNEVGMVMVTMVSKNSSPYNQAYIISGPGAGNAGDLSIDNFYKGYGYDFDTMNWIDPFSLDASDMVRNIQNAVSQIPDGYSFESVSTYEISFDSKTNGKRTETFTVLITEDGKRTVKNAGRNMVEYFELRFEVMEDGRVLYRD